MLVVANSKYLYRSGDGPRARALERHEGEAAAHGRAGEVPPAGTRAFQPKAGWHAQSWAR